MPMRVISTFWSRQRRRALPPSAVWAVAFLIAPWAGVPAAPPAHAASPATADTLAETERRFAALSVASGMREAFLEYLAEDGILFRPGPVNGPSVWRPRPESKATLDWAPNYVEVSGLADLGVSTGPWEFRTPTGDTTSHGHFFSVWKRAPGEPWKLAVDMGISHPQQEKWVRNATLRYGPTHPEPRSTKPRSGLAVGGLVFGGGSGLGLGVGTGGFQRDDDSRRMAHEVHRMMSAERTLGFDLRKKGPGYAYPRVAAEDVRFYRNGAAPSVGVTPAIAVLERSGGTRTWHPYSQAVSRSYDLGYSYGLVETRVKGVSRPDTSSYVHVWRRDAAGNWKLLADVENDYPKR